MDWREHEQQKYETVWGQYPDYRSQADGDPVVETAFREMGCKPGQSLIDWGCGKGTPAGKFQAAGLEVIGFDIACNCLDPEIVPHVPLVVGCLWDENLPPDLQADYSFCTDVLEHLPPEHLFQAIDNITKRTRKAAFIQVCTVHDTFGKKMNPPQQLHLSVYRPEEWLGMLKSRWRTVHMVLRGKSRAYYVCFR